MLKEGDRFLFAVYAGLIGGFARDIYSIIAKLIGLAKFFIWEIGADVFVDKKEIYTVAGYALGALTDFLMGGLFGVGFAVLIEIFGSRHYLIKGVGMGLMLWLFLFGFFMHMFPQTFQLAPPKALGYISAFIGHCIYGAAMGFAYIKLAKIKVPKG